MNYEMAEELERVVVLGDIIRFAGVEKAAEAVEKPPGRMKRAGRWVADKAYRSGTMINDVRARLVKKKPEDAIIPIKRR